ncbi:MAG: pyruvate kinase [Patescibacteria group bacterium]
MHLSRKTKIVATIGPASEKPEILKLLIKEGIDVARLNLSHGTHMEHQARINLIRKLSKKNGRYVAVIADLQGPKIRIGLMPEGGIELKIGKKVIINTAIFSYNGNEIPLPSKTFSKGVKKGAQILIDDGKLSLKIIGIKGNLFTARVIRGGILSSKKGVNLPMLEMASAALEKKDRADVSFAIKAGVDYVALSFLRRVEDINIVRKLIAGSGIKLIAKIERPEAMDNLSEIIKSADAVMVARGDLGIETPIWALPVKQKEIVNTSRQEMKPVIVATQMLESMIENPVPTRAEVSDVANAVYDGADAVMLSAESASGKYPVESVRMMRLIIEETEKSIPFFRVKKEIEKLPITLSVARSAKHIAYDVGAKFIFTGTASGYSARAVSHFRPKHSIFALTHDEKIARQLALVWGVIPLVVKGKTVSSLSVIAENILKKNKTVKKGDRIVFVSGLKIGAVGQTNNISVIWVK